MKQFAYPPFINPKTAEKTIRRLIYRFFSLKPPTRWIATTACCGCLNWNPSSLPRPTAQKNTAPLPASMPRWGVIKPRSPIFRLLLTAKTRKTAPISPI